MEASIYLNDHRLIDIRPGVRFQPADALEFHQASRAWLARELSTKPPEIRKTVVVTHHLPHPRSIDPRYDGDALNPAFASRMTDLVEIGGADLWIHGHTHSSCDYLAGGCRVVPTQKVTDPVGPAHQLRTAASLQCWWSKFSRERSWPFGDRALRSNDRRKADTGVSADSWRVWNAALSCRSCRSP